MQKQQSGTLYICGTPIGNLEDITLRCLAVLKQVDLITAEDTRHTKILLNHYQIKKPIISYHKYSKESKVEYLLKLLQEGKNIALLSDAGMPGVCDPGYEIINKAIDHNITIVPVPGVSALITALVVSGFPMQNFVFEGFIPRKKREKEKYFSQLKYETRTIIFYESPHRIKDTLRMLKQIVGDRKIVIARELTKKFEEIIRGNLSTIIDIFNTKEAKGEFTLVVAGKSIAENVEAKKETDWEKEEKLEKAIINYLNKGYHNKDIVSAIVQEYHISKNYVYNKILDIKKRAKQVNS